MNLTAPVIELERIRKAFPNGVVANEDVSFSATKGQIHSIVGENGAGKSTTLKSISTLLRGERGDVTKGSIEFNSSKSNWVSHRHQPSIP